MAKAGRKWYRTNATSHKRRTQVYLKPRLHKLFVAEVFLSFGESESAIANSIFEAHYARYTPSHIESLMQQYDKIVKEKTT